jgi:hypothetical protein
MSLTIDEAIARFEHNAEQNERWASGGLNPEANAEYAAEHRQLADWLRELQERRKANSCEGCRRNNGKDYICLICKRHYGDKYVTERRTND